MSEMEFSPAPGGADARSPSYPTLGGPMLDKSDSPLSRLTSAQAGVEQAIAELRVTLSAKLSAYSNEPPVSEVPDGSPVGSTALEIQVAICESHTTQIHELSGMVSRAVL